jgi:hypothetical protein
MEDVTLIIHSEDSSTDFLKPIYADIENKKIIIRDISNPELINEIQKANNFIFLGHGSSNGLFGVDESFIIDNSFSTILKSTKGKKFFIWCNADEYVINNTFSKNIIYTGMFISEVSEVFHLSEDVEFEQLMDYEMMIEESNQAFSNILGRLILENNFKDLNWIYTELKRQYLLIANHNEIAAYNYERIYLKN